MKYKIGFRLDWLEMIFILTLVFFSGFFFQSEIEDKFIYTCLLIIGAFGILIRKKVKFPLRESKTE